MTRRATLFAASFVVSVVSVLALRAYQLDARAATPMLPLTFAHRDHDAVGCVDCHHNYVDATGQGLCFDCHKTDPTVNALIESQFHEFCRGCHVDGQSLGEEHGPTRRCLECHQADDDP